MFLLRLENYEIGHCASATHRFISCWVALPRVISDALTPKALSPLCCASIPSFDGPAARTLIHNAYLILLGFSYVVRTEHRWNLRLRFLGVTRTLCLDHCQFSSDFVLHYDLLADPLRLHTVHDLFEDGFVSIRGVVTIGGEVPGDYREVLDWLIPLVELFCCTPSWLPGDSFFIRTSRPTVTPAAFIRNCPLR